MNERHQPSGAVVACSRMQKKKKSEVGIADQAVLYMMISYIFFLALKESMSRRCCKHYIT